MYRAAARVLTASALTLSALAVATQPASADSGSARRVDPNQIRVGTYNIISRTSVATFADGVEKVKPYVDVLGLQEIGLTAKHTALDKVHSWGNYAPQQKSVRGTKVGDQQNPILWNRDVLDFVSGRGVKLATGHPVEGGTGGGAEAKADNWATVVRLVHRATGEQVSFINVHLLTGVITDGVPKKSRPQAWKLYRTQLTSLVKLVKAERSSSTGNDEVYVLGDFNSSYKGDVRHGLKKLPVKTFKKAGMRPMWERSKYLKTKAGTHGKTIIDYVWNDGLPVSTAILSSVNASDHKPAVATYQLTPPAVGYLPAAGAVGFTGGYYPGSGVATYASTGSEYFDGQFMRFPLAGSSNVGWFEVVPVVTSAADEAVLGKDYTIDQRSLQPGSTYVEVRVNADGDKSESPVERFTLQIVPQGAATLTGQQTVTGTIEDSDRK